MTTPFSSATRVRRGSVVGVERGMCGGRSKEGRRRAACRTGLDAVGSEVGRRLTVALMLPHGEGVVGEGMWTSGRVRITRLNTRHMWMADIGVSKDLDGKQAGWPWIERMVISCQAQAICRDIKYMERT